MDSSPPSFGLLGRLSMILDLLISLPFPIKELGIHRLSKSVIPICLGQPQKLSVRFKPSILVQNAPSSSASCSKALYSYYGAPRDAFASLASFPCERPLPHSRYAAATMEDYKQGPKVEYNVHIRMISLSLL